MDLGKLSSTLVAEAKKSPAKVTVLGVLALVAVYFWAPLIWGWIRPSGDAAPEAAVAADGTPAPIAVTPNVVAEASPAIRADWQALSKLIHDDPRTRTVSLAKSTRNPFVALATAKPIVEGPGPGESPLPAPSVQQLGLELTSTWVGSRIRTATINGITLREGSLLVVRKDQTLQKVAAEDAKELTLADGDYAYRVVEVQPKQVTLDRSGERTVLQLKRSPAAAGSGKTPVIAAPAEKDL